MVATTPVVAPATPLSTTPNDPIGSELATGQYPACNLIVGQPESLAIQGDDGSTIDLRCITGTSTSTDHTGVGSTSCSGSSTKIYYWGAQDQDVPDQHIYAAKVGANVVIVPDTTAYLFWKIGGGLASVMLAVGVC